MHFLHTSLTAIIQPEICSTYYLFFWIWNWEVIFRNIGGVNQQMVYGLNGNAVEIAVIDNNVDPFPCSQEGIEKVAKALGQPPKLYVSTEYWWWGRRNHYHYSCELWCPFLSFMLTVFQGWITLPKRNGLQKGLNICYSAPRVFEDSMILSLPL